MGKAGKSHLAIFMLRTFVVAAFAPATGSQGLSWFAKLTNPSYMWRVRAGNDEK